MNLFVEIARQVVSLLPLQCLSLCGRVPTLESYVLCWRFEGSPVYHPSCTRLANTTELKQPQGGVFFWARLTGAGGKTKHAGEFAKKAIEQGVAFVPGAPFFAGTPDASTLRLSFATADVGKIEEGIVRLRAALRS